MKLSSKSGQTTRIGRAVGTHQQAIPAENPPFFEENSKRTTYELTLRSIKRFKTFEMVDLEPKQSFNRTMNT